MMSDAPKSTGLRGDAKIKGFASDRKACESSPFPDAQI
jgi:hypothetical protein